MNESTNGLSKPLRAVQDAIDFAHDYNNLTHADQPLSDEECAHGNTGKALAKAQAELEKVSVERETRRAYHLQTIEDSAQAADKGKPQPASLLSKFFAKSVQPEQEMRILDRLYDLKLGAVERTTNEHNHTGEMVVAWTDAQALLRRSQHKTFINDVLAALTPTFDAGGDRTNPDNDHARDVIPTVGHHFGPLRPRSKCFDSWFTSESVVYDDSHGRLPFFAKCIAEVRAQREELKT